MKWNINWKEVKIIKAWNHCVLITQIFNALLMLVILIDYENSMTISVSQVTVNYPWKENNFQELLFHSILDSSEYFPLIY